MVHFDLFSTPSFGGRKLTQPVVSVADYFEAFETFKTVVNQRAGQLNKQLIIGHSCLTMEERNKAQNGCFKFKPELVYTGVRFRCVRVQLKREQKKKGNILSILLDITLIEFRSTHLDLSMNPFNLD